MSDGADRIRDRLRPQAECGRQQDELVAVLSAGAYGFVMSSNYNARPCAAEVLVRNGQARLVRQRETYEDLVRGETV